MMPVHERIVTVYLAVVAMFLAVLLIVFGIPALWYGGEQLFGAATAGKIVEADGVRQNKRIYIENAHYDPEKNEIEYTVVNKSGQRVSDRRSSLWVEKESAEGTWFFCVDMGKVFSDQERYLERASHIDAFRSVTRRIDADLLWSEILPGEYRMVLGGSYARRFNEANEEEWYLSYPEDGYCIIGYFTITEEMLSNKRS
ncbi:MAG: hypothetical protein E7585_09305 [Ruminococcaceae bacterium]|nr:hypothetical protein [Oscillospiraceae bacterium]